MSRKPETRRQRKTQELLRREVGGIWWKIHGGPFQDAGIPDLLGCVAGYFFAFEIKEPNGKTSQLQEAVIEEIVENKGCACVIVEPEDAVRKVKEVLARRPDLVRATIRKAKARR